MSRTNTTLKISIQRLLHGQKLENSGIKGSGSASSSGSSFSGSSSSGQKVEVETSDVILEKEEERRKVTSEAKRKTTRGMEMSAQEFELERMRLTLESRLRTNELRSGIK